MNDEALSRELRTQVYEREALILANAEPDHELDAWTSWASRNPLLLD